MRCIRLGRVVDGKIVSRLQAIYLVEISDNEKCLSEELIGHKCWRVIGKFQGKTYAAVGKTLDIAKQRLEAFFQYQLTGNL